jgi:hypothetical protein
MLDINDIRREQAMAEVIAQRDLIIINQFAEMQKAAEKNKELEAQAKSLADKEKET